MRGTRFLWLAAGSPPPVETDGTPILPRDLRVEAERERRRLGKLRAAAASVEDRARLDAALAAVTETPVCAACGSPANHRLDDAISDNFTTVKNASRAWTFGGEFVCSGCLWACKTLALRCALWFARLPDEHGTGGVWFVSMRPTPGWPQRRPDPLSAILAPPPAPFIAGLPLYGIDHGGENNAHRTIWPWTEGPGQHTQHPCLRTPNPASSQRLWVPPNPLVKVQSKHCALYAEVSDSAERYRLQVDDAGDVTVDVPLWRALRVVCEQLLSDMRRLGVGATDARISLMILRPPPGLAVATRTWAQRVASLHPHHESRWWELFVNLLPMPALVKRDQAVAEEA